MDKIYSLKKNNSTKSKVTKNRSRSASPDSSPEKGKNGGHSDYEDSSDGDDDLFKQPQYRKSTSHTLA